MSITQNTKKPYAKPELESRGSVEKITLEQNKSLGPTDGYLFNGTAIQNAS